MTNLFRRNNTNPRDICDIYEKWISSLGSLHDIYVYRNRLIFERY